MRELSDVELMGALRRGLPVPPAEPPAHDMAVLTAALRQRSAKPRRRVVVLRPLPALTGLALAVGTTAGAVAAAGVPLPSPLRTVAVAIGLPVDDGAVAAVRTEMAALQQAITGGDRTTVAEEAFTLEAELRNLPPADRVAVEKDASVLLASAEALLGSPPPPPAPSVGPPAADPSQGPATTTGTAETPPSTTAPAGQSATVGHPSTASAPSAPPAPQAAEPDPGRPAPAVVSAEGSDPSSGSGDASSPPSPAGGEGSSEPSSGPGDGPTSGNAGSAEGDEGNGGARPQAPSDQPPPSTNQRGATSSSSGDPGNDSSSGPHLSGSGDTSHPGGSPSDGSRGNSSSDD